MKIKFAQVLHAMDGKPMQEMQEGSPNRDMTLGRACINALLGDVPNERQTGAKKFDRFKMAMRKGNERIGEQITRHSTRLCIDLGSSHAK